MPVTSRYLRCDTSGASMAAMPEPPRQQKITFAEMRAAGVRGLLIYCSHRNCRAIVPWLGQPELAMKAGLLQD